MELLALRFAAEMDAYNGGHDIDLPFPEPPPSPPPPSPPPPGDSQSTRVKLLSPGGGDPIAALVEQGQVYARHVEQLDLGPVRNTLRPPDKASTRNRDLMRDTRKAFLAIKEAIKHEFQMQRGEQPVSKEGHGGGGAGVGRCRGGGGVAAVTNRLVRAEADSATSTQGTNDAFTREEIRLRAEAWFHCALEDYEEERAGFLRSRGQVSKAGSTDDRSDRKAARLRRWALEIAARMYQSAGTAQLPVALLRSTLDPSPPWLSKA